MKKVVKTILVFKIVLYSIVGIMLVILVLYLNTSKSITPQEKEWQFRDSVNKAWVYKNDSIKQN